MLGEYAQLIVLITTMMIVLLLTGAAIYSVLVVGSTFNATGFGLAAFTAFIIGISACSDK